MLETKQENNRKRDCHNISGREENYSTRRLQDKVKSQADSQYDESITIPHRSIRKETRKSKNKTRVKNSKCKTPSNKSCRKKALLKNKEDNKGLIEQDENKRSWRGDMMRKIGQRKMRKHSLTENCKKTITIDAKYSLNNTEWMMKRNLCHRTQRTVEKLPRPPENTEILCG